MKEKFLRFMQGRYGADTLSKVLLGAGLIVVLLSAFLTRNAVGMVVLSAWMGPDHLLLFQDIFKKCV